MATLAEVTAWRIKTGVDIAALELTITDERARAAPVTLSERRLMSWMVERLRRRVAELRALLRFLIEGEAALAASQPHPTTAIVSPVLPAENSSIPPKPPPAWSI